MNRLGAIALFVVAVVGVRLASADHSQLELKQETGLLKGDERLFSGYCMSSRAYVNGDVSRRARETSAALFNAFFGAAAEMGDEILTVERQAVEELGKKLAVDYKTPQKDSRQQEANDDDDDGRKMTDNQRVTDEQRPMRVDEIRALLEDSKRALRDSQGPSSGVGRALGRLVATTMTAGQAMMQAANSALVVRLARLRSMMDAANLSKGIASTCQQVAVYEARLESELAATKLSLSAERADEPELQSFIDKVSLSKLNCHTTKLISRLRGFCELLKTGGAHFFKMLGISGELPQTVDRNINSGDSTGRDQA